MRDMKLPHRTTLVVCSVFVGCSTVASAQDKSADTVEITGARFREQAGKTSLSGAELARVPGASGDPMKAIQSLPGVASIDDASSEPAVRGSRPGDNAYYVDFLPVGYLFHLGGFASVFNPALIQRFSLASAAWSPEYGNVVGAVFDIQLRNPRSDRLGGQVDFGLIGANALFEGPISSEMSFFFAARRSWFDLVVKEGEDEEEGVTFTTPVYSDTQGRLLWTLNADNRLRLDFSTAADKFAFNVKSDGKAAARDPIVAGSSSNRQSYAGAALVWETDFGNTASHKIALGQMNEAFSFRLGAAGTVKVDLDTTYLRQQLLWTGWKDQELTVGTTLQSRRVNAALDFNFPRCTEFDPNCDISTAPRLTTDQRARQNEAAVYVNDRLQLHPQWVASLGLRASRDAYIDRNAYEPRLGLEYSPTPLLTLSAGTGRHSQPPAGEESLAVIGNPRLLPVESRHAVMGATLRLGDGWSGRVEAYAKTFRNYAVSDPVLNYRNGASGRARGVELLLKRDPVAGSRLSGFASLSLSRSRRTVDATGENFPFDYDQPVIANVVLNFKHTERWSYGLKWSYHSGSPYTPVVGTNGTFPDGRVRPLYGGINSQRVPAYHRLDLRADATFTPRFGLYAELINAYNRKNVSGYSYSADYSTREEVRQLPILPSVGLKYTF
jgi:outer membrane receptor for ferrienterochelin and colicin